MVNIDFRISFVIFFAYLTEILKFKNQKVEFFVNYVLPRLINWVWILSNVFLPISSWWILWESHKTVSS